MMKVDVFVKLVVAYLVLAVLIFTMLFIAYWPTYNYYNDYSLLKAKVYSLIDFTNEEIKLPQTEDNIILTVVQKKGRTTVTASIAEGIVKIEYGMTISPEYKVISESRKHMSKGTYVASIIAKVTLRSLLYALISPALILVPYLIVRSDIRLKIKEKVLNLLNKLRSKIRPAKSK